MQHITIRDVAKAAGVSPSAVSFALNKKPGVSEKTRHHILQVAENIGWRPDPVATALSKQQSNAIGFVLTRPANTVRDEGFFFPFLCGVSESLAETNRQLIFRLASSSRDELEIYRSWATTRQVAGVILVDLANNDPRPAVLAELAIASVCVGYDSGIGSALMVDDSSAMIQIVDHLYAQGFHHPAYISGIAGFEHTQARRSAFTTRCSDLGISSAHTFTSNYTRDAGAGLTRTITENHPETDVIVYDNELLTFGGISYLHSQNIAIPDQIGIFSWEDSIPCQVASPPISTLARDPEALGAQAADILLRSLEAGEPVVEPFPTPTVIARATTSRLN